MNMNMDSGSCLSWRGAIAVALLLVLLGEFSSSLTSTSYIAGDLGGTNCRLVLVLVEGESELVLLERIYSSKQHSHLIVILKTFLEEIKHLKSHANLHPQVLTMAVAGPVENGKATITNLNWALDANDISMQLQIKEVILINDFAAVGYGLLRLTPEHLITINGVSANTTAPIACLGAGTGLGEVFLTHNGKQYDVWPSEGGHTDFAARTEIEFELLNFVRSSNNVDRVSVERVVSGPGLPLVYNFLKSKHPKLISDAVERQMQQEDASKIITEHGLAQTDVLCQQAFELWLGLFGAEAGNLALKTLCYGGLYIAGGIAPKIKAAFENSDVFWRNLRSKGRMMSKIEHIPVHVVVHPNVGMLGSRVLSRRHLDKLAQQ